MNLWTVAVSVSTRGVSPCTSTVSATVAGERVKARSTDWPTRSETSRTWVLKPDWLTVIR